MSINAAFRISWSMSIQSKWKRNSGATSDEILGMVESIEDVMDRAGILFDEEETPVELGTEMEAEK